MKGKRISNLDKYIEENYEDAEFIESSEIDVSNFLQKDFEVGASNCTIASLTRIINYYYKDMDKFYIYDEVFKIARRSGYFKDFGTIPFFISHISNKFCYNNNLKLRCRGVYLGSFYSNVKEEIDSFRPVVMNLGSGYYKRHTLVVFGYSIYEFKGMKLKILKVYDGWNKTPSYIDYNALKGFMKAPIFSYNIFNIDLS